MKVLFESSNILLVTTLHSHLAEVKGAALLKLSVLCTECRNILLDHYIITLLLIYLFAEVEGAILLKVLRVSAVI